MQRPSPKPIKEISNAFGRAVEAMGLNAGVEDQRYKVCFHTLRHTFASWHVEGGTDLYTLKELMGHSTLAMTERYSHLGMGALHNATKNLEKNLPKIAEGNVRNFLVTFKSCGTAQMRASFSKPETEQVVSGTA